MDIVVCIKQVPDPEIPTSQFKVDEQTKFIGPKGGKGDGLKDDRMEKGNEVKILPSTDGKLAMEVHLPFRKKAASDKDKK